MTTGNPYADAGLALFQTGANILENRSARKAQKELDRARRRILDQQAQTYAQVQPQYMNQLQQMAMQIGPQADRGAFGRGGQFGSLGTQQKFAAGQEAAERYAKLRGGNLMAQMQQRGIPTGSAGSALAGNERALQSNLLGFRRQLSIGEEEDQQRKQQQYMAALAAMMGQGSQAAGGYGEMGAAQGQRAAGAAAGAGQAISNWQQQRAMQDYMRSLSAQPPPPGFPGPTSPAPWSPQGTVNRYDPFAPRAEANWWEQF